MLWLVMTLAVWGQASAQSVPGGVCKGVTTVKRALGILAVKVAEEPTADRVVLTALLRH